MSDAPRSLLSDTNKFLDKKGIKDYQPKIGSLLYLANQTLVIQNHQHKKMLFQSTGFSYTCQVHHLLVLH